MIRRPAPGDGVTQWPVLLAVVSMAINDHVLKGAAPGLLTGKLSDVAGLVLLPVLLQAWIEVAQAATGHYRRPSDRVLVGAVLASAAGFALVNVWVPAELAWQHAWGWAQVPARSLVAGRLVEVAPVVHHADLTDLLTLPAVAVPLLVARARHRARPPSARRGRRTRPAAAVAVRPSGPGGRPAAGPPGERWPG